MGQVLKKQSGCFEKSLDIVKTRLTHYVVNRISKEDKSMTNQELYDQVLDDFVHGDIYEPQSMIRDLIMLLDPEAVERFAELYEYSVDSEAE